MLRYNNFLCGQLFIYFYLHHYIFNVCFENKVLFLRIIISEHTYVHTYIHAIIGITKNIKCIDKHNTVDNSSNVLTL